MVSYTFKWPHPGDEVYVTGTFDNWSKSEQMEKVGDKFEKSVELPDTSERIYYKFVVDGTWTSNPTDPKEKDESGNENNVLTPEALLASLPATAAIMNSVSADSTTAQLAKDVPLEKDIKAQPETETTEPKAENGDAKPSDLPGSFPETPADELNKTVGVNPLPAAAGGVNPIKLAPGEPIPNDLKTADVNSNVKLDAESYEKSDALPGVDSKDLSVPPVSGTMIPESSLPMGTSADPHINSVSADSTTAALAAEVPKEPKVPEVVKESQDKAGVDPEASGIAEEVKEKEQVEEELKEKVPEAPSTSEGTAGKGTEKSENDKTLLETAAAAAAGVSAAAVATAVAAKDKAVETAAPIAAQNLPESVKQQLPASVQETINATGAEKTIETVSPEVPPEVKDSIVESGKSPEAAANTAAVEEKKAVEAELLKEVKPAESAEGSKSEPASAAEEAPKATADETPKTTTDEPKVVEPPAAAAEVPKVSEPTGNGASNGTTANGSEAPATPAKNKDTKPSNSATPNSATSEQKRKNRISGFFGKIKAKIANKDSHKDASKNASSKDASKDASKEPATEPAKEPATEPAKEAATEASK